MFRQIIFSMVLISVILFSSTESNSRETVYIGIQGGLTEWTCQTNDCELEAGTDNEKPQLGGFIGIRFRPFERFNTRIEFQGDWRQHEVHGLNGDKCQKNPKNWSRNGKTMCHADTDLNVTTFMLNVWPGISVIKNRVAVYGGGGVGGIYFDAIDHDAFAWGARFGGGVEVRLHSFDDVGSLVLDAGYKGLLALETRQMDGHTVDYFSHGPVLRLSWEF